MATPTRRPEDLGELEAQTGGMTDFSSNTATPTHNSIPKHHGVSSSSNSSSTGHIDADDRAHDGDRDGAGKDIEEKEDLAASPSPPPLPPAEPSQGSSSNNVLSLSHSRAMETVAHEEALLALAWMSLLTGLIDGLTYSRTSVWVGFQTGNIVTFSLGVADFIYPWAPIKPRLLTLLRFCSFGTFFVASFVGNAALSKRWYRFFGVKSKWAHSTRMWLVCSSLFQAALLFAAAGILWSRPEDEAPSFQYYPPVMVLISFSMGLQSILAQKLASPVFSTSVAFTATLTQLASDPHLFTPRLSFIGSHKEVKGRDLRIFALFCLAVGGGLAQTLLDSSAGFRGAMTVGAAFKVVLALLFWSTKGTKQVLA
ncbi:unnamed protein product [Parajaminaea phylloscopi]